MKFVLSIALSILLFSCVNEKEREKSLIEKYIIGGWTIDYMTDSLDEPVLLMHNLMSFKRNGEFSSFFIENGNWVINWDSANNVRLYINSNSLAYKNSFIVKFFKDEKNKLLKIKLDSKDFTIVCSKMLFNYDQNLNRIAKLVEVSKLGSN